VLSAQYVERETRRDNDDKEWRGRNMIKPVSLLFLLFSLPMPCSSDREKEDKKMSTLMFAIIIRANLHYTNY
jgi:hypothetical protein